MFQVMKALLPFNSKFRVLALSATPGCDIQAVTQVCIVFYITSVLWEPSKKKVTIVLKKAAEISSVRDFQTTI
jgi:ERCC4-related helicase